MSERGRSAWSGFTRTCSAPTATGATRSCSSGAPGCAACRSRSSRSTPTSRCPRDGDIYLMGGGEDLPQTLATRRLLADGGLHEAAEPRRGGVRGLRGLPDARHGVRRRRRRAGPRARPARHPQRPRRARARSARSSPTSTPRLNVRRLTGFENHQGVTRLGPNARPLARTTLGTGNGDGTEGAYAGRVLGTYLHGPALVRNPGLADLLLLLGRRAAAAAAAAGRGTGQPAARRAPRRGQPCSVTPGPASRRAPGRRPRPPRRRTSPRPRSAPRRSRPRRDVPAGRALAADGHRAEGEHRGEQVVERRGVRQREVVRPAGQPRTRPPRRSARARPAHRWPPRSAATVKAWLHRSGSSLPAVTLITRVRATPEL